MDNQKIRWRILDLPKRVFKKGGSFAVIIPHNAAKYLNLSEGDELLFLIDVESGRVVISNKKHFNELKIGNEIATLGFPLNVKELEDLIKTFKE